MTNLAVLGARDFEGINVLPTYLLYPCGDGLSLMRTVWYKLSQYLAPFLSPTSST